MVEQRVFWNDIFRLEPFPTLKPMKCIWCKSFLERIVEFNLRNTPRSIGHCAECNAPLELNDYVEGNKSDEWICRRCFRILVGRCKMVSKKRIHNKSILADLLLL